jgi:hypothetical protein
MQELHDVGMGGGSQRQAELRRRLGRDILLLFSSPLL